MPHVEAANSGGRQQRSVSKTSIFPFKPKGVATKAEIAKRGGAGAPLADLLLTQPEETIRKAAAAPFHQLPTKQVGRCRKPRSRPDWRAARFWSNASPEDRWDLIGRTAAYRCGRNGLEWPSTGRNGQEKPRVEKFQGYYFDFSEPASPNCHRAPHPRNNSAARGKEEDPRPAKYCPGAGRSYHPDRGQLPYGTKDHAALRNFRSGPAPRRQMADGRTRGAGAMAHQDPGSISTSICGCGCGPRPSRGSGAPCSRRILREPLGWRAGPGGRRRGHHGPRFPVVRSGVKVAVVDTEPAKVVATTTIYPHEPGAGVGTKRWRRWGKPRRCNIASI